MQLCFHSFSIKLIPNIDGTKTHQGVEFVRKLPVNEFKKKYFSLFEVYFRSPFGHLPVKKEHTRDSSYGDFSANLEPLRARLRAVLSKIACFHTPPVYRRKDGGSVWGLVCLSA